MFPVSENEVSLMQMRHYLYQEIWETNFSAPVEELMRNQNARVLDIGCGPGTWILENAVEYENATFTGIDVASVYPQDIKPPNTEFCRVNILDGLPFPDNTFDFVHCRDMMFVFTMRDWEEQVIPELIRVTKSGGWLEIMEGDIMWYNEGIITTTIRNQIVDSIRQQCNIEPIISPHISQMMSTTGQLSTVQQNERLAPLGKWGGDIGKANLEVVKWGAEILAEFISRNMGFTEHEYKELLNKGFNEIDNGKVFSKTHRFWAKKIYFEQDLFKGF
ncbi:hypothetical protein G9A89_008552 [Geosiphon pyriformis]|nr:hypothetical protein G9A89_008552 [Geosiphon pyriformis]